MQTSVGGDTFYVLVYGTTRSDNSRGGGARCPPYLHSAVDLLQKSVSKILLMHKENHPLVLFSDIGGIWYYTLYFTFKI